MSIADKELTALAFCWKLQRRDGVTLGFTTHDRDLEIDDLLYRASPGMLPSAITSSDGFGAANLEISGALTSESITDLDLSMGRWDQAELSIFITDWEIPGGEQILVARGRLGDVSQKGNSFVTELRGPTAVLDQAVVEQTSPECRADLGDKKCRVDMSERIITTRISSVISDHEIEVQNAASGTNIYGYGRLRWISGANSGLQTEILSSANLRLTLREAPYFQASVGDLVEIIEGCDKSLSMCVQRFANAENFRGEPHLPGMDLLTRYASR